MRQILLEGLRAYRVRFPEEAATVDAFAALVANEPRCFQRDCWRGHVTGSAWLVDATGGRVLLTHHRKLGRWLQLGGHSDGDENTLRVACREAMEESGLRVVPVGNDLFDIDIHLIPAREDDPAHHHFDARFALRVVESNDYRVSDESHALRWIDIHSISAVTDEPSMLRMAAKWLELRSRGN